MNIGMNGDDRHGRLEPDQPGSPAPLEHRDHHAVRRPDAEQVENPALSGTSTDRKTSISRTRDIVSTAAINTGSRWLTRAPTSAKLEWPSVHRRVPARGFLQLLWAVRRRATARPSSLSEGSKASAGPERVPVSMPPRHVLRNNCDNAPFPRAV